MCTLVGLGAVRERAGLMDAARMPCFLIELPLDPGVGLDPGNLGD